MSLYTRRINLLYTDAFKSRCVSRQPPSPLTLQMAQTYPDILYWSWKDQHATSSCAGIFKLLPCQKWRKLILNEIRVPVNWGFMSCHAHQRKSYTEILTQNLNHVLRSDHYYPRFRKNPIHLGSPFSESKQQAHNSAIVYVLFVREVYEQKITFNIGWVGGWYQHRNIFRNNSWVPFMSSDKNALGCLSVMAGPWMIRGKFNFDFHIDRFRVMGCRQAEE